MPFFQSRSRPALHSVIRALGSGATVGLLAAALAAPGLAEGLSSDDVKAGGRRDAQGTFTITNETLEAARKTPRPTPQEAPQARPEAPLPRAQPVERETCLSVELLNETGARGAQVAEQYFLTELDQVAREFDLETPAGWSAAAPALEALSSRLQKSAAEAFDSDVQRLLFGFARDMQETASWVAARPDESAEKFRRGEPIFTGRF